jgi:RNA polymerase sigma-70 factor (ECF subfamily)
VRLLARKPTEGRAPPPADASDADLVRAAHADPLTFDRLYDRYDDSILTYCYYRLGTWEDAEDAAQQVFANAYARLGAFRDGPGSFRAWLFTIAHHEVANRKRGRARHPAAPFDAARDVADAGPTPEELAIAADHQGRALALLSHLSPDQRQVVEFRFAGLSDAEIGTVLGRSPGAVRAVQARAVARLRDLLGVRTTREGGGDD